MSKDKKTNESIKKKSVFWKYFLIYSILSILVFFFFILWQNSFNFLSIINSIYMVGIMYFVAGWFMIMNNYSLFSMITYSFKALGSWIKGNKAEKSYYDYATSIKKIPKKVWVPTILLSIPFILIGITLNIIFVMTQI